MSGAVEPTTAIVNIVLTAGMAGVGLVAFWREWIVTGTAHKREQKKAEELQKLYETEVKAHAATREALLMATRRADSADMLGEAAIRLLDGLSAEHGRRDVVAQTAHPNPPKEISGAPDGSGS